MNDTQISVRIDALHQCMAACLRALGHADQDAARMAEVFLDSELRGYDDHGAVMVEAYAGWVRSGASDPRGKLEVVRETATSVLLEANRGNGPSAATEAMRRAMVKAREHGLGCAGVRNSGHFVAAAPYVEMAARDGLVGFACANTTALTAAPGSTSRIFGTNPLAYGIPAARHEPLLFDMATSAIAGGKVRMAAAAGKRLPEGVLLDVDGSPTTDPNAYLRGGAILPMGGEQSGHKGFGLAMVVDALSGALTGAGFALSAGIAANKAGEGRLFLVIDPEMFMPRDEFARRIDQLIDQVKAAKRQPGVDEIWVPGERGLRRRAELRAAGVLPLVPATWASLERTASGLGVPRPTRV
jgi:LDH2 family malate/lactate/ureidoglycolate dehydrogenase